MAKPPGPTAPTLVLVDHLDVDETFVDAMERLTFDGNSTVRMEFVVNRLDEFKEGAPLSGKKHVACRLVMPIGGVPHLYNQLANLMAAMEKRGLVHRNQPKPAEAPAKK